MQIHGGLLLTGLKWRAGSILTDGHRIEHVGSPGPAPGGGPAIDADGLLVCPGFIDLQINGGYGMDLVTEPSSMWELARRLPATGVTSFLPTIITSPPESITAAKAALADRPSGFLGAAPLGLHLEGPMLSHERRGAHRACFLTKADPSVIEGWSATDGIALVTLAPELPGAVEVIEQLRSRGVIVSGGHSSATFEQGTVARRAGMSMVTHLFNAMEPLSHRNPNLVGLALTEPGVVAGLIVDGVHIDPAVVALTLKAKGSRGIALVTDAIAAAGMAPGPHSFDSRPVTADGLAVRFDDGSLAGSCLTLDLAVRNLVEFTDCSPADAVATVTSTPARVLGDGERGSLVPGARADLTLLRPDLTVAITIGDGRILHVADGERERLDPSLSIPR